MTEPELDKCKQIGRGDFVEYWKDDTLLHCNFKDGWQMWFNEKRELHRDNGPAVVKPDGTEMWYENGNFKKQHKSNNSILC